MTPFSPPSPDWACKPGNEPAHRTRASSPSKMATGTRNALTPNWRAPATCTTSGCAPDRPAPQRDGNETPNETATTVPTKTQRALQRETQRNTQRKGNETPNETPDNHNHKNNPQNPKRVLRLLQQIPTLCLIVGDRALRDAAPRELGCQPIGRCHRSGATWPTKPACATQCPRSISTWRPRNSRTTGTQKRATPRRPTGARPGSTGR